MKISNNSLANFIAQLNLGSLRRLRYIVIFYSRFYINILQLLYKEGIIRLFFLKKNKIFIYFKYLKGCSLFKFKLISKPSKRIFVSINKLNLIYNKENFSGFFIISTPLGLLTSNECCLYRNLSGEILFKVYL